MSRVSVKALYEGKTGDVWRSVLANVFAERGGSSVGSIDRTNMGQFVFRSNLDALVSEIDWRSLNEGISEQFVRQNPVEKYVVFSPDQEWLKYNPIERSILRSTELRVALEIAPDYATFNGYSKVDIVAVRGNAVGELARHSDAAKIAEGYWNANRIDQPKLYFDGRIFDPAISSPRAFLGAADMSPNG